MLGCLAALLLLLPTQGAGAGPPADVTDLGLGEGWVDVLPAAAANDILGGMTDSFVFLLEMGGTCTVLVAAVLGESAGAVQSHDGHGPRCAAVAHRSTSSRKNTCRYFERCSQSRAAPRACVTHRFLAFFHKQMRLHNSEFPIIKVK